MCKIFKENEFNITVACNLSVSDFSDGTFYLYRKQNNELLYIHKQSNHLPSITKQIPLIISKQISDISCDSDHFYKAAPEYDAALKKVVSMEI